MDEQILAALARLQPATAQEVADAVGLDVDRVERRLRVMYGVRVTADTALRRMVDEAASWRLIDAAPLPYLTTSTESLALAFRLGGA